MTYTLKTNTDPILVHPVSYGNLGKAFEKATDLMQYMGAGSEILIINDLGQAVYSVKFVTIRQFTITELI